MSRLAECGAAMTGAEWMQEAVDLINRQGLADRADVYDARSIDMTTRKDGVERRYEADFVKYVVTAVKMGWAP